MSNIVSVHSFQVGSGKSQIASNMAVLLANQGQRVALIDANLQSPSASLLFGLKDNEGPGLDDYLLGRCTIRQTVRDLSSALAIGPQGRLFIVATGFEPGNISALLRGDIPAEALKSAIHDLDHDLQLDTLIVDTSAGLNEHALVFIAMTTALAVTMLLDQRDYQGTGTTIEVAQKLGVPTVGLIVNDVPAMYDFAQVKAEVENTYGCPAVIIPHSDELAALSGRGVFTLQYPDHPVTTALQEAIAMLMA